jgi:hypothetical protein
MRHRRIPSFSPPILLMPVRYRTSPACGLGDVSPIAIHPRVGCKPKVTLERCAQKEEFHYHSDVGPGWRASLCAVRT